jgi:hypothetical protein
LTILESFVCEVDVKVLCCNLKHRLGDVARLRLGSIYQRSNSHSYVEVQHLICSAADLIALERVQLFSAAPVRNNISLQSSVVTVINDGISRVKESLPSGQATF